MLLFCTPPVDIYGRSLLRVKQCGGGGEGCRGSREVHKGSLFKFARHVEFANLPFENDGVLSLIPLLVKRCLMLNPLSAIKLSHSLSLLNNLTITGTPRPEFGDEGESSTGCNSNQYSKCIMVFIVTPCCLSCTWGSKLVNKKLWCINDHSCVRVFLESLWKLSLHFFTGWTANQANIPCMLSQFYEWGSRNMSPRCRFRTPKRSLQSTKR